MSDAAYSLAQSCLAVSVPLRILEMKEKGGPDEEDLRKAAEFNDTDKFHHEYLMFRSPREGETAAVFNRLAHVIACLAFAPGGVNTFGTHWDAKDWPPKYRRRRVRR